MKSRLEETCKRQELDQAAAIEVDNVTANLCTTSDLIGRRSQVRWRQVPAGGA
jgi:hypothetical protein